MSSETIIHIIDDDTAILTSIAGFLVTMGFGVRTYLSAQTFLESAGPNTTGCVVTDVRMPDISGLELVIKMKDRGLSLPIILITAYADISLTVEAMKRNVADLLEKPFNNGDLVKAIRDALANWKEPAPGLSTEIVGARFANLTVGEKEVLQRLLKGTPNKIIANELGLSVRTLETYRATVMSKMKAASVAELVKMLLSLQII
jgi:two-component system, LuxR family, response regulator FixJ